MDKTIEEAINNLNATVRRLIFAYECDRGLELGRNGYYKKEEALQELLDGEPEDPRTEEILDFVQSKTSKAERRAFFQKQIDLLNQEAN